MTKPIQPDIEALKAGLIELLGWKRCGASHDSTTRLCDGYRDEHVSAHHRMPEPSVLRFVHDQQVTIAEMENVQKATLRALSKQNLAVAERDATIEGLRTERNRLHVLVVDKLLKRTGATGGSFKCLVCGEVDMHCIPCPVGAALREARDE